MKAGKLSTDFEVMNKDKERKLYKESKRNQYRGIFDTPPRPRARVRYAEAGAAADELIAILGGKHKNDRGTWGYYCYHHDIETILEKAREIASRHRQGELKWPIRAFQRWLQRSYGRVGA